MTELAHPIACIYREAVASHTWPESWSMEHQCLIPKVPVPQTKDEMRNLGKSPFLSKSLEWILVCWIWPVVSRYLSPDQLGGQKGSGTNHYIARLIQFIYSELDGGVSGDSEG